MYGTFTLTRQVIKVDGSVYLTDKQVEDMLPSLTHFVTSELEALASKLKEMYPDLLITIQKV